MTAIDDRTPEDRTTHPYLVKARDSFLSGWGGAAGGYSVAAWACRPGDVDAVLRWVQNRDEMKYVRVVTAKGYRPPRTTAHYHVYVVKDGHPAVTP